MIKMEENKLKLDATFKVRLNDEKILKVKFVNGKLIDTKNYWSGWDKKEQKEKN